MKSTKELFNTFCTLRDMNHEGIRGVKLFKGVQDGPTVGVTICTHGNEPAGLSAAEFLFSLKEPLKKGRLFLVLNNIAATEKFFAATTEEEKRLTRFTDINLNRLPGSLFENDNETRYEILRMRELLPVFKQFEIALDMHSTSQDSEPMLIGIGSGLPKDLIKGFPIRKIISNIDTVMRTKPAVYFYGNEAQPARAFGVECGGHEISDSYDRAITCVRALLVNLGMLEGSVDEAFSSYEEYFVESSVYFPDTTYELTRVFENFEFLPKETILATGSGDDIVTESDTHALFAPKTTKPTSINEEVLFLTKPVRKYEVR